MEKKVLTFEVDSKYASQLQELGAAIDVKRSVIDTMFTNHRNDSDSSVFESPAFKTYENSLKDITKDYEALKNEYQESVLKPQVIDAVGDVSFTWNIDFFKGVVTVEVA